jgi:hypothetical protein
MQDQGPEPERGVLVGDPRQQLVRQALRVVHQGGGENRDRTGQRPLLGALGLVATVEQPVEQIRVLGEYVFVEPLGDRADVLPDDRQGRRDHRPGPVGRREHVATCTHRRGGYTWRPGTAGPVGWVSP